MDINPIDQLDPQRGTATADDGTTLCYQLFGDREREVVFANGIGVRHEGFTLQILHLRDRHRIITWDYRGIGDSRLSHPDADLSIRTHAHDLLTVLDAVGAEEAVLAGWSMGVQVSLEVYRLHPERVKAIVAIAGTFGRPFGTTILRVPKVERLVLAATEVGRTFPQLPDAILAMAVRLPSVAERVLRTIGFMNGKAHPQVMRSNIQGVAAVDKRVYMSTMRHLGLHDARSMLPQVQCPVLILAGSRDTVTPPDVARQMHSLLPDSRLVVMDNTTHFNLIEEPAVLNRHLDDFLTDIHG